MVVVTWIYVIKFHNTHTHKVSTCKTWNLSKICRLHKCKFPDCGIILVTIGVNLMEVTEDFSVYFLTPLLRYNSHTIEFTQIKYIIQWILIYLQFCTTTTTVSIRTFSLPQKKKKNPVPLAITLLSPSTSPHSQATFCLYTFAYSGHFVISGMIFYMVFCDELLSLSIMLT